MLRLRLCSGSGYAQAQAMLRLRLCSGSGYAQAQAMLRLKITYYTKRI